MTRSHQITDPSAIREIVAGHGRWWHEIEVAPGIVTPGEDTNRKKLPILDQLGLPTDLNGARLLDIGCSDGYFSFEMENRGAEVVAVDFVPESYSGFATARKILASDVTYCMDNVYNLSPGDYGEFDVILFLGVLYHLRKPLAALDAIRSVLKPQGSLFVATFLIDEFFLLPDGTVTTLDDLNPLLKSVPIWQAYPGDSLNGDSTNCFAPNLRGLEAALEEAQFKVEATLAFPGSGFARACAVIDERASKYQRLDSRLQDAPFDPEVPYFLDDEYAVHAVTGRQTRIPEDEGDDSAPHEPREDAE